MFPYFFLWSEFPGFFSQNGPVQILNWPFFLVEIFVIFPECDEKVRYSLEQLGKNCAKKN